MTAPALAAVGLGESLLRLSAPGQERLGQAARFDVHVGGAEMNVLITLSAFGFHARWVTRMADNPLGRAIVRHAVEHGVEPLADWDSQARVPLYFVEHGALPRPSEVVYDRSDTAMTRLTPSSFSWQGAVEGSQVALSSGITCALGTEPSRAVTSFFDAARESDAMTVFDINYRARLWSWDQAIPVLRDVLPFVDVLSASRHDLLRLVEGASDHQGTTELARQAIRLWGHRVVLLRETVHTAPGLASVRATAVTPDRVLTSPEHAAQVVDPFGAGDASLGAFLASWLTGGELAEAVNVSAWAGAFHQTVIGDTWQGRPSDVISSVEARRVLR